ncbi:MAG TPA: efflux RND transporter permease subunit [Verrucomicrobiae bacterium]|nr:efflux RND transporter permease subunit [Verrucomicrobiae bacterium]
MSDLITAPAPPSHRPPSEDVETAHWTARFGKPIIFVILVLVAVGIYLATNIPVAVFPDTDFPRIVIGVDNGVFPIDQMLVTVTKPLEDAVNTVPGLDHLFSITSRGTVEIDLFFNWNVDMYRTLNLVDAAMSQIQSQLPATAKINTARMTFAAFPIMGYSLTSDKLPQTTLWEMATYDIKPRLNRQLGVSQVTIQGGQVPEFEIRPDPAKLAQTGVTIQNILDAVGKTNMIDSPGMIEANHELILSLVSGQTRTPDEIANIVIKTTPADAPVRVGDVATVGPSVMPVYTVVTANNKPAVLLNIYRQPAGNTVQVANAIHAEIEQLRKELPKTVELRPFYDQSELVNDSIASVRDAIVLGLVLASFIMVLFLRDWGTSLVAGLVIPATIAVTFIALRMMGQTFNLMTLGGLAAAVGLVIDDAIVVVENIVMHRDSGQSRAEAIRSAIREIRVPLVGSTITPIVVFLPLVSVAGVDGVFFRALAVTVGMALLTSLALALTWTPTLSHYFIRSRTRRDHTEHHTVPGWIMNPYERILRVTLEHKWVLALGSLVVIGVAYLCATNIGSDLLPPMDEGGFIVDYIMPAGSSLAETNRVISHVERILKSIPEVENISRRTGMQLGPAQVTEANTGDISVKLKRQRKRSADDVIADARGRIKKAEPVLDIEIPQLLQDMIGDLTSAPEPVVIKLFDQNPTELIQWSTAVGDALKKMGGGVVDVEDGVENTISGPARTFNVDPVVAARAGFTPQEVELDASAILQGEPAANPVVVNDRSYNIRVRFPQHPDQPFESILDTMLISSSGKTATIGSLAKMVEIPGQTEIRRDNLQRNSQVTARFEGINTGDGMAKVKQVIADLKLPPSIRLEYGGLYAEQQKSFKDFEFVGVLAVILVFGVLLFEFGNFGAPLAVLASALLSLSGVLVALLITKTTLNLSSFMGLIMVVGIVAKNGILLLDADQKFRAEGMAPEDSMIRAGERRLRPIMMTALATVAGMAPLAFGLGAGSQMLQPLAIAVIGGIAASMVLSLVVTPAVRYYLGGRG